MQLVIDDNAGFCFGVVRAIGTAEAELQGAGSLYCLGDIVHNAAEVARLRERGLKVIEHDGIERVASEKGARVLIRAHGEPPSTYREAERLGVKLIDATCPIVLALQQRIKHGYEDMCSRNPKGQVVIFGKPGHAEVVGLCGQTEGDAVVVSSAEDLDGIDFSRPMRIYSQTTKSREEYARLIENVKQRCTEAGHGNEEDFMVAYDTVCSRVANRAARLEEFARSVDAVLFVSGRGSSNGHYLFELCKRVQPRTVLLYGPEDVKGKMSELAVEGEIEKVGITGATSTPRWLMEAVAAELK